MIRRTIRALMLVLLCTSAIGLLITVVLPGLARSGYAGAVIQKSYSEGRDASALFYTESDRVMDILHDQELKETAPDEPKH